MLPKMIIQKFSIRMNNIQLSHHILILKRILMHQKYQVIFHWMIITLDTMAGFS